MRPLALNVRLLQGYALWPGESEKSSKICFLIKHAILLISLVPNGSMSLYGALRQMNHLDDITILIDQLIGLCALFACVYMCECLVRSIQKVKDLKNEIATFGTKFNAQDVLDETEKKIQSYTKIIVLYGIMGDACYSFFPLIFISNCEEDRQSTQPYKDHDPCGLITRVWYPFKISESPIFQIVFIIQYHTCLTVAILVLLITMLLVGLLMYAVALLKNCGERIKNCCEAENSEETIKNIKSCIKYHAAIIEYSKKINQAFSLMMLCHMTLTSFQVSVLGFQIIIKDSITECLRFAMHLFGWLMLLFLVCYYGQNLIDESTKIGIHAYSTPWYNAPIEVQKDIQMMILRSQKPLTLSAASLGVMSLEAFMGVISTAYSYFTLLVKMKDN